MVLVHGVVHGAVLGPGFLVLLPGTYSWSCYLVPVCSPVEGLVVSTSLYSFRIRRSLTDRESRVLMRVDRVNMIYRSK